MTLRIDLGYVPRAWQKECHARKARFTVLALHRRAGKTELALRELLDSALRFARPGPVLLRRAAAEAGQGDRLGAAQQIVSPLVMHGLAEVNESELWVRLLTNGAMIRVYGADNPDAMRGVRLDGVVIDEVAQTKPEVWDDILQPAPLIARAGRCSSGHPTGSIFSQLFYGATGLRTGTPRATRSTTPTRSTRRRWRACGPR